MLIFPYIKNRNSAIIDRKGAKDYIPCTPQNPHAHTWPVESLFAPTLILTSVLDIKEGL